MTQHLTENWSGVERVPGDRSWLEKVLKKTFINYDPYRPVVSENLSVKAVIFPTDSYHLEEAQFNALLAAVETRGDQRFYISEIECKPNPFLDRCDHWVCQRPTFEDYTRLPIGVWNAIYSPDGSWGLLLSDELHALLACDQSFWNEFSEHYPYSERDRAEFLKYWERYQKEDTYTDWLQRFLNLLNK